MMEVKKVVDVELNDVDGGFLILEYKGKFVMLGFDFGESLCSVELVERKKGGEFEGFDFSGEIMEEVFNDDEIECFYDMGYEIVE